MCLLREKEKLDRIQANNCVLEKEIIFEIQILLVKSIFISNKYK